MLIPVNLYFPISIAIGILLVSVYLYQYWSRIINRSVNEVNALSKDIGENRLTGDDVFTSAIDTSTNPRIKNLLLESKRNLITIHGETEPRRYCLKPYADFWTTRSILAGKMNLPLYETMPNLFIGAGLMFTFIFLALALNDAGQAMTGDQESRDAALKGLIATAGGKFITSIAGLFCSLIWNWRAKIAIEKLQNAIEGLEVNLRSIASDNAPQAVIHAQLGIFNELLVQNKQQVTQLKRFENDFALSIAKSIGVSLAPSFDNLSTKLIEAFDDLTDRISKVNEEALKSIMEKFLDAIKGDSAKEMEQFRLTLVDVAEKLNNAGAGVGVTMAVAGDSFGAAVGVLEKTISKTNATVNALELGLDKARSFTNDGASRLEFVVNGLTNSVQGIDKVVVNVESFVQKIQSSTESLGLIAQSLDGAVSAQKMISSEFSLGIPAMSSALKDAVNEIKLGTDMSREALNSLRVDFENTKNAIDQTVNGLTSGVSDYSNKVAQLHLKLDEKLAQAISSINSSIVTLEQTLDDFAESLPKSQN
uniref:hypothetical protein n=1 Tax=Polynucleobacter sp. TaxID=2029855 RepID=UPI004047E998